MKKQRKLKELLKIDLGCGQNKQQGFLGVDIAKCEGVNVVHDLTNFPWPFEDASVEEVHCSHYFEHIPGPARFAFMDEIYRITVPDAKVTIICPYYSSMRAVQDATHMWPPICETSFLYYNKEWRQNNKLDHYDLKGDFDFCVAPDTDILMYSLQWSKAGDIKVGNSLIGVDEFPEPRFTRRRLRQANVEFVREFNSPRVKIWTEEGDIVCTPEHGFLARRGNKALEWIKANQLQVEDEIKFVSRPWYDDRSDSWLSGLMDGEGSLSLPSSREFRTGLLLMISQNEGEVLNRVVLELKQLTKHVGQYSKGPDTKCKYAGVTTVAGIMSILGRYRPVRLLPKFQKLVSSVGLGLPPMRAKILAVEKTNDGPVIATRTSTRTLITNGLISHNSYGYAFHPEWATRSQEARDFAIKQYINVASDIYVTLIRRA